MKILLLNAGSSSLKATFVDSSDGSALARRQADWAGAVAQYRFSSGDGEFQSDKISLDGHAAAVKRFFVDLRQTKFVSNDSDVSAVGHRIVHGGSFTSSIRLTPNLRAQLAALSDLAPLHNPPSLAALTAA